MKWSITDHVCRACLGRVLASSEGGIHSVRCADCGLEAVGRVTAICACGTKLKPGQNAGLKCQRNPARGPECPAEVVASLKDAGSAAAFPSIPTAKSGKSGN